ncbi:hypothetical protein V3470_10500 [Flavobacterium oreochromis]|uniref:Uncharacterized protein n=1 Tax=Flavobacterium oreochromis TaxID=2906078 RepID=A0ABW8PAC3_9FLAO|nr:hypothetical protein [Flavobacterium oreochromis]OWP74385.1 hypothetical protein BWG23_13995 [Flavobacterium oreochromis]
MKTQPKRVCIYPKDIERITGKSYRQSTRIFNKIKEEYNKPKNSLVSIEEFCQFTGLKIEHIQEHIVG